ncbi:MAG TPA: hypothetical protein VFL91_33185, partial [Thermomicrobiales bacterium]|nr:hypothetical protein [Thermomicrobiales bacterium]
MRRHTATAYSRHGVTLTLGLTLLLAGAIGLLRTAPAAAAPALVGDSKWAYPATYQGRHYVLFSQVQGSDLALELAASADGASWTVLDPLPGAGKAPNYPRLVVTPDGLHAAWADDAGDGGVYFATSGADPSDLAGWRVERIADRGKNVGLAATADGSLLVTWDDNASAWVRRRGPDAQWGEAANLDLPCGSPCLVTVGAQPGGRAAVAFVDSGRNVVFTRFDAAGGWRRLDGGTRLSTAQANHWPQLATGPDGSAHVVWSQASGPGGAWEIQYARCDAAGRCSSPERVSRNLNGSLDRWPTVSVGADGVPSVAWQGDDAGPKGVYQIYARTRGGDADPWPDYADPSAYCVSCAGGEDAENPRYAAGSAELAYTQRDAPGQPWGIRYASGGSAAPVTTPGAAPGDNGNAGDTGAPARVSAPAPSPGEA